MFRLDNKVAAIFGGSGYLGQYICQALIEQGAIVYNYDIRPGSGKIYELLNTKHKSQYHYIELDATNQERIREEAKNLIEKEKKLDILITSTTMKTNDFYLPFEEVSLESWNVWYDG